MEKFIFFDWIQLKFCFWLYKKRWHTSWKFQLEIRSYENIIAKKPLTNLYEMNSRSRSDTKILGVLFESSCLYTVGMMAYWGFIIICLKSTISWKTQCIYKKNNYKKLTYSNIINVKWNLISWFNTVKDCHLAHISLFICII